MDNQDQVGQEVVHHGDFIFHINGTVMAATIHVGHRLFKDGVQDLGKGIKNIFGGSSDSAGSADAAPQPPK